MPSPGMRGWYVELDEKLVDHFERLFPDHGMKALLTSRAVVRAVMDKKIASPWGDPSDDISSQSPEGTNVSRDTRSPASSDRGTAADNPRASGGSEPDGTDDSTPETQ